MSDVTLCTVVARNYLHYARVLCRSFQAFHPGARVFVLLADRNDGCVDPAAEPFELIEVEDLGIPDFRPFAFKYDILEFCTAVKPYLFQHLFEQRGVEKLIYLDPDVLVTSSLGEVSELLEQHSIVLTPHLTSPIDDQREPSELDILRTGTYNLGFIGLRHTASTQALLRWWGERCYEGCFTDLEAGHFVDQRWIDLVPGLFPGVHVLREPGYNVAYWNLHERKVAWGDPPSVNGAPLRFFHFSGFTPGDLDPISKYQNRFTLDERPELRPLFLHYERLVRENGFEEASKWPYGYGCFEDGRAIPALARTLFRKLEPGERRRFGDPFATDGDDSLSRWLLAPADLEQARRERRRVDGKRRRRARRMRFSGFRGRNRPYVNNLMHFLHRNDEHLQRLFPEIGGKDDGRYIYWYLRNGGRWDDFGESFAERGERQQADAGPRRSEPPEKPERGIALNVAGYFRAETGVGECARTYARLAGSAGLPHVRNDFRATHSTRLGDSVQGGFSTKNPHPFNLIVVNADEMPRFAKEFGKRYFRKRYTIGCWHWELADFPERWSDAFRYLDELWVPSRFCQEALAPLAPVPVQVMPDPVDPTLGQELSRSDFGLPEGVPLFLVAFDFLSFFERKNPIAAIRAFRRAFGAGGAGSPMLVVKTSNGSRFPEELAALSREAEGLNVKFIEAALSRNQIYNLMRLCDCFVSLHRSEGYGLMLAEAMYFGRSVIGTAYSGNMDFMDESNSLLVPHRMVEIERSVGPYDAGGTWADPDVDEAAHRMRFVVEHPEQAAERAARGQRDVRESLGIERLGERVRRRLEVLAR